MANKTRQDLAQAVVRLGITEPRALQAVDVFFDAILRALQEGQKVTLTNFGTWEWRDRPARNARNPKTGATVALKARRVLVFHPSRQLKKKLNSVPDKENYVRG